MDNLLVEHRGRDHLPRQAAQDPQVHAADRRDVHPRPARRGPVDRDLRQQTGPPRAGRRPEARAGERAVGRARAPRRRGQVVLPAHPPLPRQGRHRRRRAHADRRQRPQGRRGRAVPRALPARTACSRPFPTRSTSRTRAAGSSAPTTRWRRGSGSGRRPTRSGKTALELPEQSAAMELHQQDEAVLRDGRGAALQAREARAVGRERWRVGSGDAAAAARSAKAASSASSRSSAT